MNSLDYEKLVVANFYIDVIEDFDIETRQTLNLAIVNMDDESPSLSTSACVMKVIVVKLHGLFWNYCIKCTVTLCLILRFLNFSNF